MKAEVIEYWKREDILKMPRKRTPLTDKGKKKKAEYDVNYAANNIVRARVDINRVTEPELVEVWESIPNKSQWLKDRLREYAKQPDSE